ncbi:hypothetical protein ACWCP6_07205 [Streptomyces sp. NPDC002004]
MANSTTQDNGASACFIPHGDQLVVCDLRADGRHPGVYYKVYGQWYDSDAAVAGPLPDCWILNLDLAESAQIAFFAANWDKGTLKSVGDTASAWANS